MSNFIQILLSEHHYRQQQKLAAEQACFRALLAASSDNATKRQNFQTFVHWYADIPQCQQLFREQNFRPLHTFLNSKNKRR